MKKILIAALIAVLMGCAIFAVAEPVTQMGMANPWTATTAEELVNTVGVTFGVPADAEDVEYYVMAADNLAEMKFDIGEGDYVARIKPTAQFEDISGLFVEWISEETVTIGYCEGVLKTGVSEDDTYVLCQWYDAAPGLMYSVSCETDVDAASVPFSTVCESVFLPAQGEVDGVADVAEADATLDMANPWTETTAEELVNTVGVTFGVPENAEGVLYRVLAADNLAEMQFALDGAQFVARIKPVAEPEDISGVSAEWAAEETAQVNYCEATLKTGVSDGNTVALCQWYDAAPGLMYSVFCTAPEGVQPDVATVCDAVFVPAQGDVDGVEEEVMPSEEEFTADAFQQIFSNCTGYAGSAGASLKAASAANDLLYLAIERNVAAMPEDTLKNVVATAYATLSEEQQAEFVENIPELISLVDSAFADFEAVRGTFEDAGVAEITESLLADATALDCWTALQAQLVF
ncbi:MAG: hypothetical protein U0L09_06795 [Christensenellales bacterium]|nr:hypothetical protein [Christensenellales bacterium]